MERVEPGLGSRVVKVARDLSSNARVGSWCAHDQGAGATSGAVAEKKIYFVFVAL